MTDRILRPAEVQRRTGLGRTTIWRRERAGDFPRRRRLGPTLVGWLESELDDWLENLPFADQESDPEAT